MAGVRQDKAQGIPSSLVSTLRDDGSVHQESDRRLVKKLANVKLPPLAVITTPQDASPGNVWHHHKQRHRFKCLTDSTQCVCGAGRDISFLYDACTSDINDDVFSKANNVPKSLIPEEFHVVKHPGVLGLELYDEPYSAITGSHDRHYTTFPSMRPSGRQEVMELKNTLDQMIGSIGLAEFVKEMDLKGPTQMHNLIRLIKKEQEIYNICFHELIRQVTVHCAERGALLAEIRQCYTNLLSKVPYQVRSLHDEVIAQRALDRKLTTELSRLHGLLTKLTGDLHELRDHNELASEEIEETKESLMLALSESEKNANLLLEYSNLYELQRNRLEDQIAQISNEKELWEQTCYQLAVNVADYHQLESVKQLQLSGKSWEKLASHFTIMLSDRNTSQLCTIQSDVQKWRRDCAIFLEDLKGIEQKIIAEMTVVYEDMNLWLAKLKNMQQSHTTPNIQERNEIEQFWQALKDWLRVLNHLSETFSGECLLDRVDKLQLLRVCMSRWSDTSLAILQHRVNLSVVSEASDSFERTDFQRESITSLVDDIEMSIESLSTRTTGENGIAITFVQLISPMESWDTSFNLMLHGGKQFTESNFLKLTSQLETWSSQISVALKSLSSPNLPYCQSESFVEILNKVDKWCSVFCHGVQVEDNHLLEQVAHLYSSIMRWMSQTLLAMTDSAYDAQVVSNLRANCNLLCNKLDTHTNEISKSCQSMLKEIANDRVSVNNELMDEEKDQLGKMQDEAKNWMRLSTILMEYLSSMEKHTDEHVNNMEDTEALNEQHGNAIMTIGVDDNVKEVNLLYGVKSENHEMVAEDLDLFTEEELPEGRGGQTEEVEKLVFLLDELKIKLSTMETKAINEEKRANEAERLLKEMESHADQLKLELKQIQDDILEQNTLKKGRRGTKSKAKDSK